METDQQLIDKILKGEAAPFESLVNKYYNRVLGFMHKMGLSREDAEELAQDTMVKAYRSLSKYNSRFTFSTWLYHIARNTCLDFLRRAKPPAFEWIDNLDQVAAAGINEVDRMIAAEEIKLMLRSLKPDVRAMLLLHYYNGLTLCEIARICHVSPEAVKMKLYRARGKLMTLNGSKG